MLGIGKVQALTTNEVIYNNNGVEENLTETLDTLYTELKGYKTGGNVTPSEMLEGSSGYSKGILVTGNIKKKEATTYTPGVNDITISKGQYLNGNQVILGDTHLKSENIKSGVEIFGIKGSIKDNSGKTLEATNITNDDTYTYLTIPEEAIYDGTSKIKIENEVLKDNIDNQNSNLNIGLTSFQNIDSWVDINVKIYKNAEINITPNDLELYYIDNVGQTNYIGRYNAGSYIIDISNYEYIRFQSPTKSSSDSFPARTIVTGTLS